MSKTTNLFMHSFNGLTTFRLCTFTLAISFLGFGACSVHSSKAKLDKQYGLENVKKRLLPVGHTEGKLYSEQVKPIIESRCVVCHGCYDSPCQLKLGAMEGIDRGGTKEVVYDSTRLRTAKPTRLFEDAKSTEEWRDKGFHPVLNERQDTPEANREGGVLYQMLALKKQHPLPSGNELPDFDFALDREQTCPSIQEFPKYAKEHPTWGMPYGLPALSADDMSTVTRWVEAGAQYSDTDSISAAHQAEVEKWEAFLNRKSKKSQLVSRYLYEHWFLAHLYFSDAEVEHDSDDIEYFYIVRSSTPPGEPVSLIATRRPFDEPNPAKFYYRFTPLKTPVLVKNHQPYSLSNKRKARIEELFFEPEYAVSALPGYESKAAANPIATFAELPIQSRYRFLLDDARYIIEGFIKGPVCRGQTSLNVINDRFWIVFADPDMTATKFDEKFLKENHSLLEMPASNDSDALFLSTWTKYSKRHNKFIQARSAHINKHFGKRSKVTLDLIWDGDGTNDSAALTVFRHEDSATVVKGLVGTPPKTSWMLGYVSLERIHYLLVAGFDIFGRVGHQLSTRLYMDFLRMEAEANILTFLPKASRDALRDKWYEGAEKAAKKFINGKHTTFQGETGVVYKTKDPLREFYGMLKNRVGAVLSSDYEWGDSNSVEMKSVSDRFKRLVGGPVVFLPQVSFLRVDSGQGESRYYTLIRDNYHTNISSLLSEVDNRRPQLDRLTLVPGLLGAYPNALFRLSEADLDKFARSLESMKSEKDYSILKDRFGVRRNDLKFWEYSDKLYEESRSYAGQPHGIFDYNRLENR